MQEIHAIAVGEGSEYGDRLVRYLEKHVPPSVRIYHYTSPDTWRSMKEGADYYLADENFGPLPDRLAREKPDGRCIVLSETEGEGTFSRIRPPAELLTMMGMDHVHDNPAGKNHLRSCSITALYSPVYERNLMTVAMTFMEEGDLYLGFEDLGPGEGAGSNAGDLCYYIHIRDEHILDIMEDLCDHSNGIFKLDSPDLFFCLKELTPEDYHWFFDRLRLSRRFAGVFVGIGNGFLSHPDLFGLFDRIVLIDSVERPRQHALCGRLRQALLSDAIDFRGEVEEYFREDVEGRGIHTVSPSFDKDSQERFGAG